MGSTKVSNINANRYYVSYTYQTPPPTDLNDSISSLWRYWRYSSPKGQKLEMCWIQSTDVSRANIKR